MSGLRDFDPPEFNSPPEIANDAAKAVRSPRHIEALRLVREGVRVFPLAAGSKVPPAGSSGFKDASADAARVNAWWRSGDHNLAMCPADAGLFVLDVDPRNGGDESLAALEAAHGALPATYTVRTPSGGRHLYFKGSAPSSAGRLGRGLDIRGVGGYVVLPPSFLTEYRGAAYEIADNRPNVEPPGWLIGAATAAKQAARAASADIELDRPLSIAAANAEIARLLEKRDVAIEGRGGDTRTYKLAARMGDLGVSEDMAVEIMEPWNAACDPPWEPADFAAKVAQGYKSRQNALGCDAPETAQEAFGEHVRAFDPASETTAREQDEWRALVDSFRGRKPSEGAKLPPPTFHDEDGLLPKFDGGAVGFVYGPSGAYKSALLLSKLMGLAFARGVRVAFYAGEGANGVETVRIPAICEAMGRTLAELDKVWLTIPRAVDFQDKRSVDALIEAAGDFGPDIIVTDTLASALGGLDENEAKTAALFTGNGHAYRIARALGATCIYVAHTGKDPKKDIRGSSGFIANTDFALRLAANREIGAVDLFVKKMRDGRDQFTVQHKVDKAANGVPVIRKMTDEERENIPHANARYDGIKRDVLTAMKKLHAASGSNPSTNVLAQTIIQPKRGQSETDRQADIAHMTKKLEKLVRPNTRTKKPGPFSLWVERDQHGDAIHPLRWDCDIFAMDDGGEDDE